MCAVCHTDGARLLWQMWACGTRTWRRPVAICSRWVGGCVGGWVGGWVARMFGKAVQDALTSAEWLIWVGPLARMRLSASPAWPYALWRMQGGGHVFAGMFPFGPATKYLALSSAGHYDWRVAAR